MHAVRTRLTGRSRRLTLSLCWQEHLFLVCELLRANLYEFQKFNRESGDPPYFTLGRIQKIAQQVSSLAGPASVVNHSWIAAGLPESPTPAISHWPNADAANETTV